MKTLLQLKRLTLLSMLCCLAGCVTREASSVHLAGFPVGHGTKLPSELRGWPGVERTFAGEHCKLTYLTATIDDDYCRFCESTLKAAGVEGVKVITVNQAIYMEGQNYQGDITNPDHLYINFELENRHGFRERNSVDYLLSAETQKPVIPHGLNTDDQANHYAAYIAKDFEGAAVKLAQNVKEEDFAR